MSGIAALFHADGAPASGRDLDKMTNAIAYRGPDGIESWIDGPVALGHCLLRTTDESLEEQQPLGNEDESVVLIMDGYLVNWEELRRELGDLGARLRTSSDAELVLRAYEKWGTGCAIHLDGEFAVLIWDRRRREVCCIRDHQGLRPMFYYWDGRRLLVASDVASVVAGLSSKPPLNHGYLAEMMAEQWYSRNETIWSGIMRVLPANTMVVGPTGLKQQTYWSVPLEVSIHYSNEEDYVAHYRELLIDCVRRSSRSRSPLAFEVSGGLDSSSLFCIAHKLLKEGKLLAPDFQGYTLSGPAGSDADELEFARKVGMYSGRKIREVPLFMPGLDEFARQARQDCDIPGYPNGIMSAGLDRVVHDEGCRVIINGIGGDQWLDGVPRYYDEELAGREWSELAQSLKLDREHLGLIRTSKMFAKALVRRMLPTGARDLLQPLMSQPPAEPYWLDDHARGELARRRIAHEWQLRKQGRWHYKEAKLYFAFNLLALDLISRQRARNNLEVRSPMLMRKFIEFSAATPERLRMQGGASKLIHRKAMRGILPDSIVSRKSKAEFSITWQSLERELRTWLQPRLEDGLPFDLDRIGSRRLGEIVSKNGINDWPFWEIWAIYAATALVDADA